MTPFALLLQRCGLSRREAAAVLSMRPDSVDSAISGRRSAPPGAIAELRALHARIERAADEMLALIARMEADGAAPDEIVLGLASDDHEARQPPLGWPCVGAQAAAFGLVIARSPHRFRLVPRGSEPVTASAADAHERSI